MNKIKYLLTPAERRFRCWMWFSFFMYAFGLPFFLIFGRQIAAGLNRFPAMIVHNPPWPPAGVGMEVNFWQVLGVSLMAILALVCLFIARDVRRFGPVILALLAAKLVSTLCYGGFYIADGNGAYLVGALTDGFIFLLTAVLWLMASPGDRYLDRHETRVLTAVGEALLPQGGTLPKGYDEAQERCLIETRRMLAAQIEQDVLMTRIMLRLVDVLPFFLGFSRRFHNLAVPARAAFFERMEACRISLLRIMATGLKLYVVAPFFNVPEGEERAVDESA